MFRFIIGFLSIFIIQPLWADEASVLTLDEAVKQVLAANPDIQAAGFKAEAARARIPQAKALDDPMVGVMFDDVPIDTTNVRRSEEIDYRIEQKIPFPGKRYVRGKAARFEAKATEELSRGRVQDVLLDLKRTYYDIYRLDRLLEVNRETQGLLRQFLGSAKTWYATGRTTVDTPLKAEVELSKLKNEFLLLEQERITHHSHLKALLNRAGHNEIRLPKTLKWPDLKTSLEEIQTLAGVSRPELGTLREMEKQERSKLTSARQGLLPDFSLGFQYGRRPGAQDTWTGTAMVNLPIFFLGKNRGEIREAKASLKATEAEHRSMETHTRHEVDQAYSAVQAAEKIIASYRQGILPQARTTLESARIAYASRKIDFMTLIDAARTYKEVQASFFENQARLGISFAELERLVGKNLEGL